MYVARLRYIQSIHESPGCRNPDTLVRHFLPFLDRVRSAWLGRDALSKLREEPFYYYLLARTKYYDQVINDAVDGGLRQIVGVGCGSDTRAYRFKQLLCSKGVRVLECDQPAAIRVKQRLAKRWQPFNHVEYLPIDLNDERWPELEGWLAAHPGLKALVVMEGVSPYVNDRNFVRFLSLLGSELPAGSQVAYDYKIRGSRDDFGREGRTEQPFRLSLKLEEVAAFHREHGLILERLEGSSQLCARLLPEVTTPDRAVFDEDALVSLQVAQR